MDLLLGLFTIVLNVFYAIFSRIIFLIPSNIQSSLNYIAATIQSANAYFPVDTLFQCIGFFALYFAIGYSIRILLFLWHTIAGIFGAGGAGGAHMQSNNNLKKNRMQFRSSRQAGSDRVN